ncbi:hypothetical protein [Dactylosporangium sp. CA-139066]|uniref:hypothetical protein n=1 Tax=Dactylosporangium sp. CA-139066 TaxID=3239930 RepID=UPI003D8D960A
MTPLTADVVLVSLAAFPDPCGPIYDHALRMDWMAARFDAGDLAGAGEAALAELASGYLERSFGVNGPRILASLGPQRALAAILEVWGLRRTWPNALGSERGNHIATVLARAVAGHAGAEEILLQAVLEPSPDESRLPGRGYRRVRVSGVIASFSQASPADAEAVQRWAAVLAASPYDDTPSLAAAAAQLAPVDAPGRAHALVRAAMAGFRVPVNAAVTAVRLAVPPADRGLGDVERVVAGGVAAVVVEHQDPAGGQLLPPVVVDRRGDCRVRQRCSRAVAVHERGDAVEVEDVGGLDASRSRSVDQTSPASGARRI